MLKQDIAAYVDGWVIKRETDAAPRRMLAEDIDFLNDLVSDQQGKTHAMAWQALSAALSGWLVQRARGERPGALGASDFEAFLAFLPVPFDSQVTPDPVEETVDTQEISAGHDDSPPPENLAPENPEAPPASETPAITLDPPAGDLVETQVAEDTPTSEAPITEIPEIQEIPALSEAVIAPGSEPCRQPDEVSQPDRFAGLMFKQDIAAYVDGWVIKRETDTAPRRILAEDIDFLNDLVSDQQGKTHATAWQALSAALGGWLVQRARGERPGTLDTGDFEAFLSLLPASSDPQATPDPAEETVETQAVETQVAKDTPASEAPITEVSAPQEIPASPPGPEPRRQPDEAPDPDRFAGLAFSRYHVENGV